MATKDDGSRPRSASTGKRAPRRARADGGDESAPRLPHERDASSDSQESAPRRVLQQAHDDIEQGQQDTDRRGTRGYEKPENYGKQRGKREGKR